MVNWTEIAGDLQTQLTTALTVIIPVAVAIFGVVIGWKYLRRFLGK